MVAPTRSPDDAVVVTSYGPIKGKHLPAGPGSVTAYLGIPYAEPPVGKLRFQKPHPHQPWSQVLEATDFGNACIQFIISNTSDAQMWAPNRPLSEDCLFLNVWAPHPRPSSPVPVLVWIHGGAFFAGTSSLDVLNGAGLASQEKVIVVSTNYRLGALGFLSLPPAAPGNMGLLDQQLALNWVKENAAAFGGDPSQVTISGSSAGAASVGFHLLSPSSQPLFAQAILQSGDPTAVWAWKSPEEARQKALALSQLLGCAEGNASAVVSCLQEKDAKELAPHEMSLFQNSSFFLDFPFVPTTDGDFLPDDPEELLQDGHIQVKPILIGVTSNEASTFVPFVFPDTIHNQMTEEQFQEGIKGIQINVTQEVVQALTLMYSKEGPEPVPYRQALVRFFSDYYIICPAAEFTSKLREAGSPVYFYVFKHYTSGSFWPEWFGAHHGADLPYVFGTLESVLDVNQTYTQAEAALSRRMMRYWAEFSRSGSPTGSGASGEEWSLYNPTQQNLFYLRTESSNVTELSPFQHCDSLKQHVGKSTGQDTSEGLPKTSSPGEMSMLHDENPLPAEALRGVREI
ncbi:Cholinesterase [Varanus komodoensis]|nr:Cholinesterase [Varanus komodoensis]